MSALLFPCINIIVVLNVNIYLCMYVCVEYIKSSNERAILRDEDASTVVEGGWKKINTLKHYWVKEGAIFRLIQRRDYAPPGRGME